MNRVRDTEHASFTSLVISPTDDMSMKTTRFYKCFASCVAMKWDQTYSQTLSWLRSRITFSLLYSAIQCIRGSHSHII